MSFFVAFSPNKCLLSAYVVTRSLTSASSHLSRFTVVETSPVNEELQKNFSELFMQHFTRVTCTGKKKLRTSKNFYLPLFTLLFMTYIRHIRAAINFLYLALERGRQSTRSSPERLFAKSFQKTDHDQPPCLLNHEGAWMLKKDRERHGTGDRERKSVNGTHCNRELNGTTS